MNFEEILKSCPANILEAYEDMHTYDQDELMGKFEAICQQHTPLEQLHKELSELIEGREVYEPDCNDGIYYFDTDNWQEVEEPRYFSHNITSTPYGSNPRKMIILSHFSHGDYVGSSIERSNYEVLMEDFEHEVKSLSDMFGSKSVYIWADQKISKELKEALDSLQAYGVLDDEHLSNLERELQWEAWEEDGFQDRIHDVLKENNEAYEKAWDGLTQGRESELKSEILRELEESGWYPEIETGCVVYFPKLDSERWDTVTATINKFFGAKVC